MRFRLPLLALIVIAPGLAMWLASGCGGTTQGAPDAAKDVMTMDQQVADVAPDVAMEAGCEAGSLNNLIPDGGVDAGGLPLGACLDCFQSDCSSQVNACNGDCTCREQVISVITCVEMTGDFQTCGEDAVLTGDTNLQALFGCAYSSCLTICTGAIDGGSSADASSDAPKD